MALHRLPALTISVVLLVSACAPGEDTASPPAPILQPVDAALEGLVAAEGGPPGAVAVLRRGDEVEVHTAGVADVGDGRRITGEDWMRIASVAKAFTGATSLALVARAALSTGTTVGALLPQQPQSWAPVTLAQLLQHTSGLPDFSKSPTFQETLRADPMATFTPQQLLGFAAALPVEFPPGSQYHYSNTDNIVVALMVEAVSGTSYEDAIKALVADPLGLRRAELPLTSELPSPEIRGYMPGDDGAPEDVTNVVSVSASWASGGVIASPADLAGFMSGYVGGRLFDRPTLAVQRQVVPGNSEPRGPGENAAGLGVFRYTTRCGVVWGHTGNTIGYTQFAAATEDGTRAVTVSVSAQITERTDPELLEQLRAAEETAVCQLLEGT